MLSRFRSRSGAGQGEVSRLLLTVGAFAVGALVVGGQWGCSSEKAGPPPPSGPVPVVTALVERRDVPIELRAFGVVESKMNVPIVPQVTGRITDVFFQEGDFVKAGQRLFTIDTRPYTATLAAAEAELARTRALLEQARSEQARYERMGEANVANDQEIMQARANAASAAAAVQLAEATIASARLNVNFTQVVSPIEGKTGSLLVHPGNVVQAGSAQPLVVVRSLSPVQVRFSVPERHLPEVRASLSEGSPVVRVVPRADGAEPVEGRLTFLENSVDVGTGTLALKAEFANIDATLWPGAAVDVVLVLRMEKDAVVAPNSAISDGQKGSFAFVIDEQKRAELRPVEVAFRTGDLAVIRDGLGRGDQVVTDGQVRLRAGLPVVIQAPAAFNQESGTKGPPAAPSPAAPSPAAPSSKGP